MDVSGMYASPVPVPIHITFYKSGMWIYGIRYSAAAPPAGCSSDGNMVDDYWHLKRALRSGRYRVVLSNDMPLDALQLEKCQAMGLVRATAEVGV